MKRAVIVLAAFVSLAVIPPAGAQQPPVSQLDVNAVPRLNADGVRRVQALLRHLPSGLSELYLHPATDDDYPGHAPGYNYRDELAALTDADVRAELDRQAIALGRFVDFVEGRRAA